MVRSLVANNSVNWIQLIADRIFTAEFKPQLMIET